MRSLNVWIETNMPAFHVHIFKIKMNESGWSPFC